MKRKIWILMLACCCIGIQCSKQLYHPFETVVVPFVLSDYNNIIFEVVLNGMDTLDLKFDSGATGLLLTHEAIREKTTLLEHDADPTENYVKLSSVVSLKIGSLSWDSLEVYPVALSGQGTDGRFGWDLFEGKVVSLDYDNSRMIIEDELPDTSGYTSTALTPAKSLLCVNGALAVKGKEYKSCFLFDTGYQKTLLLDSVLRRDQDFPDDLELIKVNSLRNGAGKEFITKVVLLPSLDIGHQGLQDIPVQLLNTNNPSGMNIHILGNEVLKRFNTIMDYKNMTIYLKKNSLYSLPYRDAS